MWDDRTLLEFKPEDQAEIYNGLVMAQQLAYTISSNAGWHTDLETGEPKEGNFAERIALAHSELSEALEAHRKGKKYDDKLTDKDAIAVELADCVIRIFDTASTLNLHLADAYLSKCLYNVHREDHKLENRIKEGGKRY